MPINNAELVNVIRKVAEDENITACVRESGKGALITGACAFAGGLIAGPIGLGIGGVLGAVSAAVKGSGQYKPVPYIIMFEMTPEQQNALATSLRNAIADFQVEDAALLLTMILTNQSLKALVITELGKFMRSEMGLALSV